MKQKIIDTNVLLRYFLQDIEPQNQKANEFFTLVESGEIIGKVSILVLDELIWAFRKYYKVERGGYIPKLIKILSLKNIKIIETDKEVIISVLEEMIKKNVDFTDIYLSKIAKRDEMLSFDKDFQKL